MRKSSTKTAILLFIVSSIISIFAFGITSKAVSPLEAIEKYKKDIISSSRKTGVWASVTAAQLILESGNPMSKLATEDNNFFGIKWSESFKKKYPGAKPVNYSTNEHQGTGGQVTIKDNFAHFPTVQDGITEHSIIWWNGMYEPELKILENLNSTMDEFLREMGNGPYATDVDYYGKLRKVINDNKLEELDKLAFPEGRKFCGFGDRKVGEYNYPDDGYNGSASDVGTVEKGKDGKGYVVVKESELEGMYPESFFLDKYDDIKLPSYDDLSLEEKINLGKIKEGIEIQNSWSLWDTVRVFTVFVGLCILVYAVVFIASYLFDRSNNLIEISLISMLSFGHLQFSDEETEIKGYVNKSRLIKIELALFGVGFFLVAGGLFSFILDVLWYTEKLIN